MHNRLLGLVVCLLIAACSGAETSAQQNVFTVTFRFAGTPSLALSVADPQGHIVGRTCRIEADPFGSETTCSVVWTEPGNPGVLVFDLLATGSGLSLCQTQLRTGTAAGAVSVALWNGPNLRISPPMATSLGGRCGYVITTNSNF